MRDQKSINANTLFILIRLKLQEDCKENNNMDEHLSNWEPRND